MSTNKPRWRTVDDIPGYVGDRIVAICQWSEQRGRPSCQHVVVLIVREDGPATDDEGLGLSLHDCDYWMPEAEFLRLFGPEVP